jgi:hypothetical protein
MSNGNGIGHFISTAPSYQVMSVTPDMARQWLRGNTHNRRINKGHVRRLSSDIVDGRWKFNPDPVSFDDSGTLLNGQHRLTAIAETGVPAQLAVCFNVPADAMSVMDQGVPRGLKDIASVSKREAAVATVMCCGLARLSSDYPSKSELASFHRRFMDEIRFAIGICSTAVVGVRVATVPAVVARAACGHIDRGVLADFGQVLTTGMPSGIRPQDATVIRLRERLISGFNSRNSKADTYGAIERALLGYAHGEVLGKIYPSKTELFPLPDRIGE